MRIVPLLLGPILLLGGCAQLAPDVPLPVSAMHAESAAIPDGSPLSRSGARRPERAAAEPTSLGARIDLPRRQEHDTRAGVKFAEASSQESWSYQIATDTASDRNPKPQSYLRVTNAYMTDILSRADWRFWNNAQDELRREMNTDSVQTLVQCSFVSCTRTETLDVSLSAEQLRRATGTGLRLTLRSKSGQEKEVTMPAGEANQR